MDRPSIGRLNWPDPVSAGAYRKSFAGCHRKTEMPSKFTCLNQVREGNSSCFAAMRGSKPTSPQRAGEIVVPAVVGETNSNASQARLRGLAQWNFNESVLDMWRGRHQD